MTGTTQGRPDHHQSHSASRTARRVAFWTTVLTVIGAGIWLGLVFLAPCLRDRFPRAASLIYGLYSPLCHQIPHRCFSLAGHPLAVCARCLGIYSGFLLGAGLYPLLRGFGTIALPRTAAFVSVSAPIVIDTLANVLRLWTTSNAVRLATGMIWGLILPYYFIPGIADAVLAPKFRLNSNRDSP